MVPVRGNMNRLRNRLTRIAIGIAAEFKRALNITSPSRVWIDDGFSWNKIEVGGKPLPPIEASPWYAARDSRDPYESAELRSSAKRVRRLIRRHWFALVYQPDEPIAIAVKAFLRNPPNECTTSRESEPIAAIREAVASGKIIVDPVKLDEFAKECGFVKDGAP